MRQAYGELGRFLGGQTFTTFGNVAASPATLDWQINYGDGIASLLGGLPDVTPVGTYSEALLGYFGWMIGATHDWNSKLSSNLAKK